jgi:hypothetical protein
MGGSDVQWDAGLTSGDLPQGVDLLLQSKRRRIGRRTGGPFEPNHGA